MSLALFVTISIILILSGRMTVLTFLQRERISCMVGMMIAMGNGMMTGLAAGTIIGAVYGDNLLLSIFWGVLCGVTAGFLPGMFISLMAVLDGMLAGLMGGMMGAMLVDMVAPNQREVLVKLTLLIFTGMMLILLRMMHQEISIVVNKGKKPLLHNPVIMALVIIIFFVTYGQLGFQEWGGDLRIEDQQLEKEHHHNHSP